MSNDQHDEHSRDLGRGRTQAKHDARAYDELAEKLFELPEARRRKFPGSDAMERALLVNRVHLEKSAKKRQLRHIAGLLRYEGFTPDALREYIAGNTKAFDDPGELDLEALRAELSEKNTFDVALDRAAAELPHVDTSLVTKYARAVHDNDDQRSFRALFKELRRAADELERQTDEDS